MEKKYLITYQENVIERDIPKLSKPIRELIKGAIEHRLEHDPIGFGKPLRYSLKGYRRLRVGAYRIVYRIDFIAHNIVIIAIKHRKDIYEDA